MAKSVCIIGSGNWGSAIAKIIGAKCNEGGEFNKQVNMYVYEEMIDGKKLTEIINTQHENVKYLPGHKLPTNVVAIPDLVEAAKDADLLVFVVPHQFIRGFCDKLNGKIKPNTIGISLIKGMDHTKEGLQLISDVIRNNLKIDVSVLMGANLAGGVADGNFCETTVGCKNLQHGNLFKRLLQTPNFRICVVEDSNTVEICGALKNIVACGAGFVNALGLGDNTKAAVIRLGLMEMIKFAKAFFPEQPPQMATFLESCGIADLITTCYGGRNMRVSEAFAKTGKSIEDLEKEMLNGQKLQGPQTAAEVYKVLQTLHIEDKEYPLFVSVYNIFYNNHSVSSFIKCLQDHPEHM